MPRNVRTHTRTTPSGKKTNVRQHTRRGMAGQVPGPPRRKLGPNPGHAKKLALRSRAAGRRGKKGVATAFAVLAAGEVAAWLTLSTTSALLALAAGVLAFASYMLIR